MIGAGRKIVGENEITINARTSLSASLSELTKATEVGNLVLMGSDQPLTGLQIESSDQGFFIIPGTSFQIQSCLLEWATPEPRQRWDGHRTAAPPSLLRMA